MATANSKSTNNLGLPEIKDAGIKSLGIGIAATLAVFAVQVAVVSGKSLLASGKGLADSLKT